MSEDSKGARARGHRAFRGTGGWAARQGRRMADRFLGGAASGAGTALAGLAVLWLRTRL
ncbi:hypothetical protein [Streptomyces fuscigenes]|uniref:hypothetical protein n=1 Tax=Streptomyces fuscigenes TaxID=1528880 RepID=UPI001F412214|nr:hypothetical protein [Streptomyces fuscigenes]MCF3962296.1 hypothetical protein [Streptomyces fuscigenes]